MIVEHIPIASISPTLPSNFKSFRILRHAPRRIALRLPFCRVHNEIKRNVGIRSSYQRRGLRFPAFICKMGRPRVSSGSENYCSVANNVSAILYIPLLDIDTEDEAKVVTGEELPL